MVYNQESAESIPMHFCKSATPVWPALYSGAEYSQHPRLSLGKEESFDVWLAVVTVDQQCLPQAPTVGNVDSQFFHVACEML